jgi:hypothetical protein
MKTILAAAAIAGGFGDNAVQHFGTEREAT